MDTPAFNALRGIDTRKRVDKSLYHAAIEADEEEDDGVVLSFLARKSPHTNRSSAVHWARCNRRRVAWLVMLLTRSVSTVLQGQGQE